MFIAPHSFSPSPARLREGTDHAQASSLSATTCVLIHIAAYVVLYAGRRRKGRPFSLHAMVHAVVSGMQAAMNYR